jgi:hypothetical protein
MWRSLFIACAYMLALPFLIIWGMIRIARYVRLLTLSVSPSIACIGCRSEVALLGIWRCRCGFTYKGHLMRPCPVCARVPRVVRCLNCSVTTQLN